LLQPVFLGASTDMTLHTFVLRFSCENRPGIVAALSTALFEAGFNLRDSQHFDEVEHNWFYSRLVVEHVRSWTEGEIALMLKPAIEKFAIEVDVHDQSVLRRVLLLASKFDHCLADLLYRWRSGEIPMEVIGIVSNHPIETYAHLDFGRVPFHHLPMGDGGKPAQEARIVELIRDQQVDLVVLARYMQILSEDLCAKLAGRCINIHHSFLPGFKGARPYHQAFERGVKLIGATAHYVTSDLDEGPIIEQDVERISHRDSPEQLVAKGRDIERRVLSRAVRYHLEDRVLRNGRKTIVFPD
jgi:formyltetrahydrofolate deformylase